MTRSWSMSCASPSRGAVIDTAENSKSIRKFESIGTHSYAEIAATGQAIDFYETVGPERKATRLRYLKNYWAKQLRDEPRVRFGVSLAPEHSAGSAHVGIEGIEGGALSRWMIEKKRIWVYGPISSSAVDGVYVAPNLYTRNSTCSSRPCARLRVAASASEE